MYEPNRPDKSKLFRVYIGDLGEYGNADDLRSAFARYGSVQDVWVAHKPPGFAFVFYKSAREAQEAVRADGKMVCGVRVRVRMGTDSDSGYGRDYEQTSRERRGNGGRGNSSREQYSSSRAGRPDHYSSSGRDKFDNNYSPPPRGGSSGWGKSDHHSSSSRGYTRGQGYKNTTTSAYSSRSAPEDVYTTPSPSSSSRRYQQQQQQVASGGSGGRKNYDSPQQSQRYAHRGGEERYGSGGARESRNRGRGDSPEQFGRFVTSDGADHRRRGEDRYPQYQERSQYPGYKDRGRGRGGYRGQNDQPKVTTSYHRSRSRSFSPPVRHDHRNPRQQRGWSGDAARDELQSQSSFGRRSNYEENHYRKEATYKSRPHQDEFDSYSGGNKKKEFLFESSNSSNRYSKAGEAVYRSDREVRSDRAVRSDREVKYRGRQQQQQSALPSSSTSRRRYSSDEDFPKRQASSSYLQEGATFEEHTRSERGSSLEGIDMEDKYSDVVLIDRDPNDLRRKLLSEADSERNTRDASPLDRGFKRSSTDPSSGRITSPIRV